MVIDSIAIKEDLVKTIIGVRGNSSVILAQGKVEAIRFTQHHADQELQADACAVRLLSRTFPDPRRLATAIDAS